MSDQFEHERTARKQCPVLVGDLRCILPTGHECDHNAGILGTKFTTIEVNLVVPPATRG